MVDYLVDSPLAGSVADRIRGSEIHVPVHFDAEVLSALGRLHRAGSLTEADVAERVDLTAEAPFQRHLLAPLLAGAWVLHRNVRLVDALYLELASRLEVPVVTTDSGMASASPAAELIAPA